MVKLQLNKETIAVLDEEMLGQVYGADDEPRLPNTKFGCPWSTPSCWPPPC